MTSDWVGYIAGFITTICFMPQAIKLFRTRQTEGISLLAYCLYFSGISLWLFYGVMINSTPIILCNSITLIPTALIILMKWRLG